MEAKLLAFISQWNQVAHPFNWTAASFEKVLAKVDAALHPSASPPAEQARESAEPAQPQAPLRPAA